MGCTKLKGVDMNKLMIPCAALLLVGLVQAALADPQVKGLSPLEKKLLGQWYGQGGCDGNLLLRADGTFELKDYGPAGFNIAGLWKVQGKALPATLELNFKATDLSELVGTTMRVKILKLDDKNLTVEYAHPNGSPSGRYERGKK